MAEKARLYLGPAGRWTADGEGAGLRLDVSVEARETAVQATNQLYRSDGQGGWRPVNDPDQLTPMHQGMDWEVWRTSREGETMHAFRGARAVDERILVLLEGMLLHDLRGRVLTDPHTAGRSFLLLPHDAKSFIERVKKAGGQMHRAELTPQRLLAEAERCEQIADELEALTRTDREAAAEAREGDFSGLPAFSRREKRLNELYRRSLAARDSGRLVAREHLPAGGSSDEQAAVAGALARLNVAMDRCSSYMEERESSSAEIARWEAHHRHGAPAPNRDPASQTLLLHELGRMLADKGHEVELIDGGTRVRTAVGWIRLDELGLEVESMPRRPQP